MGQTVSRRAGLVAPESPVALMTGRLNDRPLYAALIALARLSIACLIMARGVAMFMRM